MSVSTLTHSLTPTHGLMPQRSAFPVAMWPFRSCVLGIYLRVVADGMPLTRVLLYDTISVFAKIIFPLSPSQQFVLGQIPFFFSFLSKQAFFVFLLSCVGSLVSRLLLSCVLRGSCHVLLVLRLPCLVIALPCLLSVVWSCGSKSHTSSKESRLHPRAMQATPSFGL
jgi:hypothetical protein